MDREKYDYTDFPAVTVGGPPGDYIIRAPVVSNEYIEFAVILMTVVGASDGVIQTSGIDKPRTLDTSGNSIYNDTTFIRSQVLLCPKGNSLPVGDAFYDRVANSQGNVFIRIDSAAFATVTVKMRAKILKIIPDKFVTVKPEHKEQYHYERERRIQEAVLGSEGEIIEYSDRPGKPKTVRSLQTGSQNGLARDNQDRLGPSRRGE